MHFLELLAALGAAQGVLLLLLIGFRYRHRKNLPLALLVVVFSVRLGTIPSWNEAALLANPWLLPVTTPLPFLFGPLVWWYVRELTGTGEAPLRRIALHGIPYAADVILETAIVVATSAAAYEAVVSSIFAGAPPGWMIARNVAKVLVNLIYMGLAVRIAFARPGARVASEDNGAGGSRSVPEASVPRDRGRRLWLRGIAVAPFASLIPFAFVAVSPGASARLAAGAVAPFVILAAAMVGLIYLFSLLILVAPNVPWHSGAGVRGRAAEADAEEVLLAEAVRSRLAAGYYRDPEFTRNALAEELGVSINRLSHAVNQVYGESFPELVNRCRVDYFMRRVLTGAPARQTILELALESGFPSKSTFNRVFKDHVGVTPSAFAAAQSRSVRESVSPVGR